MKILVFGGTVFLSRAIAEDALRRGHDVTCASRGASGAPPAGAHHLVIDRDQELPGDFTTPAAEPTYDAVIDVARKPSHVRAAVAAYPEAHWVFVSTISVYADGGGTLSPIDDDVEVTSSPEAYGAMKVACEQLVRSHTQSPTIIRPGLIAGPGDPSGRFSYWPARLSDPTVNARPVLAPGDPEDPAQLIDVRDLAAWVVLCAEDRQGGTFDGTAPSLTWREFLAETSRGIGVDPPLTWVDQEFLLARDVQPWAGPDALPMWLPQPEHAAMATIDVSNSLAAGLTIRPLADTARDTLAWLRATPTAVTTGISRDREAALLEAWSNR
jgi:2'-hydroxyisoflavone reductase